MNKALTVALAGSTAYGLWWLYRNQPAMGQNDKDEAEQPVGLDFGPLDLSAYEPKEDGYKDMEFFNPSEFQGYYGLLHVALKRKLDDFRRLWGFPVYVSPAPGAVGRTYGSGWHNYIKHGEIYACDVMPVVLVGGEGRGMNSQEMIEAVGKAKAAGFTGIGAYPMWKPYPGLHLDVRTTATTLHPATWAGLKDEFTGKQYYTNIERAWA